MSLYIIEDDDGNVLTNYGDFDNAMVHAALYDGPLEPAADIERYGGHVVTLVEALDKVVVSAEEAEVLELTNAGRHSEPYENHYGLRRKQGRTTFVGFEDRLMCAYVNGWTVEKPKLFLVKVPHTDDSYFYKIGDEYCNAGDSYHLEGMTDKKWFTLAEIEHYGLQDCEREEMNDDAD